MDYLGTLNLSLFPASVRRRLAGEYVPALLNRLGADGIRVDCSHDLSIIARVQARHPDKPRLFELANPLFQPNASAADTFVLHLVRMDDGRDVGCAACRLRWVEGTLSSAFESKRLIFDQPTEAGGEFRVEAPVAHRLTDFHAAVTTGLTVMPGYRGVMKAVLRLLHLWVLSEWQFGFYVAIASDHIARTYSLDVEGYSAIHNGVMWKRPTIERPEGLWTPYRLVIAEREHWRRIASSPRLADLSQPLGAPVVPDLIGGTREAAE